MPRVPKFAEPSSYIRFFGSVQSYPGPATQSQDNAEQFIRLKTRQDPYKYHYVFANVAPGAGATNPQTFGDLELKPTHIAQVYVGISWGGRARMYLPNDQRLLKWDHLIQLTQEKDTGNIEYEDSPIDRPVKHFWLAPTVNLTPSFDVENVLTHILPARTINIQLFFLAALYQYEFVDPDKEPEIVDKLKKAQIPSRWVSFGGVV